MTSFALFPSPARPPHDPTWVDLDARRGWRAAAVAPVAALDVGDELRLAPSGTARRLDEPSGSFGGVVAPSTVAVAADCSIYLLDIVTRALRRFDRCECRFLTLPHTGGAGTGARQLIDPRGIAISRANLLVADAGAARVSVFTLRELALRGHWRAPRPGSPLLPPGSPVLAEWRPSAIAADRRGGVFVADAANGCIHRFTPDGRWRGTIDGAGDVAALAVDREGCLYARQRGHPEVTVLAPDGTVLRVVTTVAELAERFPRLPFTVDAAGIVRIAGCGAFDPAGEPVPNATMAPRVRYATAARLRTVALDSGIHRCQWHRVILRGCVPAGTSVAVSTYTAEVELPEGTIAALPAAVWAPAAVARGVDGEWDCLVRGPRGRFLWLALDFASGGAATPRVEHLRIEFPRISLARYLPAVFAADLSASDFTDRFLAVFDTTLRSVERHVDEQARLFDARTAPATPVGGARIDFLTWLGGWIGISLDPRLPEAQRRRFIRAAPRVHDRRGTRYGLWRLLLAYLGMPEPVDACAKVESCGCARRCDAPPVPCAPPPACRPYDPPPLILEHFQLRRWLFVGAGRLGEAAQLWGRRIVNRSALDANARVGETRLDGTPDPLHDPFLVHASRFTVFVPACFGREERQRRGLERLLRAESPAHARYAVEYVEPRFRIGVQSMIGLDAVVGRYPAGVTVSGTTLGRDSVIGERRDGMGSDGRAHPSLRIGSRSQVGTTTQLD